MANMTAAIVATIAARVAADFSVNFPFISNLLECEIWIATGGATVFAVHGREPAMAEFIPAQRY
jgi:hypothetical protein